MPDGVVRRSSDPAPHRLFGFSRTFLIQQQESLGKVRFTGIRLQLDGPIEDAQGLLAPSSLCDDAGHMGQHSGIVGLTVGHFLRISQGVRHIPQREMQRGEPGLDGQG